VAEINGRIDEPTKLLNTRSADCKECVKISDIEQLNVDKANQKQRNKLFYFVIFHQILGLKHQEKVIFRDRWFFSSKVAHKYYDSLH
jgi:hypothetical protein